MQAGSHPVLPALSWDIAITAPHICASSLLRAANLTVSYLAVFGSLERHKKLWPPSPLTYGSLMLDKLSAYEPSWVPARA